ncbi:MAG TPA: glycosyltransferase [Candidatus Bathyarchaeia archaeon]|nr:glycosyltransferase [Candidatus Bathyarchaeia archaeon]
MAQDESPAVAASISRSVSREVQNVPGAKSVLHIGKHYFPRKGGIETVLQYLVSYQAARMQVEVVVANEALRTRVDLLDGARITRVGCLGMVASQPICPLMPWKLTGRHEPLVHLHLPNPLAAKAYLMSGHRGRLVVSHHADTMGRRMLRRFTDPYVRQVMERAAAIIVASKRYQESSEELVEFASKCHVIPYGIDVEYFSADCRDAAEAIRAKYGPRIVLAVARLVPYKGLEYLVDAMQQVDAKLLVIGKGHLRDELTARIERLGITERVCLLGPIEDIRPYYKAAEMLVLPSVTRAEAFGMVQAEAMAAGLPVINTDLNTGVPEVSIHGLTGITVRPRDAEALAQAIKLLFDNREMRARYAEAAKMRAGQEFSVQRMSESTLRLYESVL